VLSANLWKGRADPEALGRQIEELDVDVVAVQELAEEQARVICELLPHGKLEPNPERDGMGIALRHPGKIERLPLRHRDAQVAELAPGEWPHLHDRIQLMNVHIHAPHCFPQWRSLACRRDQIRALDAYLHSVPRRRVLMGDFNATPLWPVYRSVVCHLDDAAMLHAASLRRRPGRTWGPWYRAPRLLRIDHVFLRGLSVDRFEVIEVAGSDHCGVLADLRL
jgi:endonuclease/exonuclease/phosphatase family metal-dependent hydrolase